MRCLFSLLLIATGWWLLVAVASAQDDGRDNARAAQFEREIRPVLAAQCVKCHGEKKQEGGLRLIRVPLDEGGDSGPVLEAGKPEESLIISALHHQGLEMPPDKKLSDKIIHHFERWVGAGAHWPESVDHCARPTVTSPMKIASGGPFNLCSR